MTGHEVLQALEEGPLVLGYGFNPHVVIRLTSSDFHPYELLRLARKGSRSGNGIIDRVARRKDLENRTQTQTPA